MVHQVVFLTPHEFKQRLKVSNLEGDMFSSSYGPLTLRVVEGFICSLAFSALKPLDHWIYQQPFRKISFGLRENELQNNQPQKLMLVGTPFQHRVWKQLLSIPIGSVVCYQDIASSLGDRNKSRAVGSAVGANPISWFVPCHRVLPKSGGVGNYHWGSEIKEKLLRGEGYVFKTNP